MPTGSEPHSGFTRRQIVQLGIAGGVALGVTEVATGVGAPSASAISWNYPFTTWYPNDSDFYSMGYDWYPYTPGQHRALDFSAPGGEAVHAVAAGTVTQSRYASEIGLGNIVVIEHGPSLSSVYAHLRDPGAAVGTVVPASGVVGVVGSTDARVNHLHLEFWAPDRDNRIDPAPYIQHPPAPLAGNPGWTPPNPRKDFDMIYYKATSDSTDGLIKNGNIYVQGADGPLRSLSSAETPAAEFNYGGALPAAQWTGNMLREFVKIVGLRQTGPAQGLTIGIPVLNDGRVSSTVIIF